MSKYSIPIENVIRHYDVTGKNCPQPYVDEGEWKKFKNRITKKEAINKFGKLGFTTHKEGVNIEAENLEEAQKKMFKPFFLAILIVSIICGIYAKPVTKLILLAPIS